MEYNLNDRLGWNVRLEGRIYQKEFESSVEMYIVNNEKRENIVILTLFVKKLHGNEKKKVVK